ncbi:TRAP transporter large permease [Dialister hominis]|jgi:C4-dicarboxylate transporter DctM subunit|uniref:TRAP transporter large permease n=1 Tax=Dialister TaxID=39948 RepID=UPI00033CE00E|nr:MULTISPECIES: TRAP transporter large permease subunit [environmental samples]CDD81338.1 tRAP transporter DctM subunit [Dialister sp. CAG:357]
MILAGFSLFIIFLLVIGMPVAFTLSVAGILGIIQFVDVSFLSQVPVIAYKTLDSYVLTSVPLYILMSQIMLTGRVGSGLFELGSKWMGHLPGGLGIATIFACAIFAAISGSSVATAVTIGAMAIPEMLKRGYDRKLVVGSVAAGGTLGILIPPSIPMILYGTITDESVGKLFMSGVVPGALLTVLFICYIVFASWDKPREPRSSHAEKMKSLRENIWGLFLPVIIIGGIYTGIFTPTEAAAVGTVYALAITFFVYRSVTIQDMPAILRATIKTSCMIFSIMIGAMLFGYILTILQVPQALMRLVTEGDLNRWIVMLGINIMLLILGCVLETVSIILIILPMLYPIIKALGFDPIWFNVVLLINMELALITPPVGMNLFVIKGISEDSSIQDIIAGAAPFAAIMVFEILLLCFVPEIATWLPSVLK